jgi:hypothetical protein
MKRAVLHLAAALETSMGKILFILLSFKHLIEKHRLSADRNFHKSGVEKQSAAVFFALRRL